MWGDGVVLPPAERDAWLASEGVARMQRLVDIVEREGRPWRDALAPGHQAEPGEGWYRDYPG